MPRALNLQRTSLHYRRDAFDAGMRAAGFDVVGRLKDPGPGDLLLVWNRHGANDEQARHFEARGARVLVVENGYLGKSWLGEEWFAMALGHHAGAGKWPDGGPDRWDALEVPMAPWRNGGDETIIFAQRGIGEPGVRSPDGWAEAVQRRIGGRIRRHPQAGAATVMPLCDDLRCARQVVTWNSAAAFHALLEGVPVWYDFPQWIGAGAGRPLSEWPGEPRRDDGARLAMFQRLVWAMATIDEVRTGEAIWDLLQ